MKRYLLILIVAVFLVGICTVYALQNFESVAPTEPTKPIYTPGFLTEGEHTFYQTETGEMHIGWLELDSAQYYFDAAGVMQIGWFDLNNARYYFGEDGVMQTGWLELEGIRYYFGKNGKMHIGWLEQDDLRYYFDQTGTMRTGWLLLGEHRYYLDETGIVRTGWLQEDGNTYYLDANGEVCRGKMEIDGVTHYFTSTGMEVIVANPWNFLPEDYTVDLVTAENGYKVDRSCLQDLLKMLSDCRKAGYNAQITSAYRTHATQVRLFNNQVQKYLNLGYSEEAARKEAATAVAVPGTSEHEMGLAVDLVDASYWVLDEKQENTPAQKWLMAHCWEYGFILRYPNGKSESTGIIYEPWHYRYVGKDYAKAIHESGLCLEEWLEQRNTLQAVENAVNAQLEELRRRAFVMLWHRK